MNLISGIFLRFYINLFVVRESEKTKMNLYDELESIFIYFNVSQISNIIPCLKFFKQLDVSQLCQRGNGNSAVKILKIIKLFGRQKILS